MISLILSENAVKVLKTNHPFAEAQIETLKKLNNQYDTIPISQSPLEHACCEYFLQSHCDAAIDLLNSLVSGESVYILDIPDFIHITKTTLEIPEEKQQKLLKKSRTSMIKILLAKARRMQATNKLELSQTQVRSKLNVS